MILLVERGLSRIAIATQQLRRTSAGPMLVRLTAAGAALGALILATPAGGLSSGGLSLLLPVLVGVAAGVGLFPRTRWVTVVAVLTTLDWLVATIGYGDPIELGQVGLLAAALYVMHAAAALAAVLPHDCVVAPRVLLRWAGRTGAVLGASLVVGLGGMATAGQLPAARSVVGPIVGSAVAAGLAGLLAWHLRRR